MCLLVVAKSLDYAFIPEGQLRIGETSLPALDDGSVDGVYKAAGGFLPAPLADAADLIFSLRGIGWRFGKDTFIQPEYRPLSRGAFLQATFISGFTYYLLFDASLSFIIQLPGIGTTQGGSLFYHNLPLVQRYFVSTAIMLPVSVFFLAGFAVANAFAGLIGVGILQQDPREWPPLMGKPWVADSLHVFWARHWHQALRRTFLVFGGVPGRWLAGKVGMVMGTFLGSAFFHEAPLYLIDRGFDNRVPLFFSLQGMGVVAEWIFYKSTGRKVCGPLGRVWTWMFVLGLGQILSAYLIFLCPLSI